MISFRKALLLSFLLLISGCVHVNAQSGPGMIVTYASLKTGLRLSIVSARTQSGVEFPHAGSFGPNRDWNNSGKTMGAAPDGRDLPEWVEFEWVESAHPSTSTRTREEFLALPRVRQRIAIRERVPQDVIDEVLRSKRDAPRGKLPEKMLWVFFVWTDEGIKFRWQLERDPKGPGEVRLLRAGGDALP